MRKKRGRPIPEGGVRDRLMMVRLNETEEYMLNKLAERAGIPRTEYVRLLIWEAYDVMSFENP